MKISVITPVFNDKKRAIDYVERMKKQTVAPEIVLVDGGSKDGTVEAIKKYQTTMSNLKLFKETGGVRNPANARNIGLDRATGDVAFFLDIDGWLEDDVVEKIKKEFEKHKGASVVRFTNEPMKIRAKSLIQEIYWHRDAARMRSSPWFVYRRALMPKFDVYCGYGDDKLWAADASKVIKKHGFVRSGVTTYSFQEGPVDLRQVWKRYIWYGRGGMIYCLKYGDWRHWLKMALAILSIPFVPLALIPMARGLLYALKEFKHYPQGIILIPLLESVAFPIMAIGFWQYALNKNVGLHGPGKRK